MPTTTVALVAAAGVVVLWLVVSFLPPGRGRTSVEWLATTALFLALGAWFIGLSMEARAEGRIGLLVPFGFLAFVYSSFAARRRRRAGRAGDPGGGVEEYR